MNRSRRGPRPRSRREPIARPAGIRRNRLGGEAASGRRALPQPPRVRHHRPESRRLSCLPRFFSGAGTRARASGGRQRFAQGHQAYSGPERCAAQLDRIVEREVSRRRLLRYAGELAVAVNLVAQRRERPLVGLRARPAFSPPSCMRRARPSANAKPAAADASRYESARSIIVCQSPPRSCSPAIAFNCCASARSIGAVFAANRSVSPARATSAITSGTAIENQLLPRAHRHGEWLCLSMKATCQNRPVAESCRWR